jgi:hypothetical protein
MILPGKDQSATSIGEPAQARSSIKSRDETGGGCTSFLDARVELLFKPAEPAHYHAERLWCGDTR